MKILLSLLLVLLSATCFSQNLTLNNSFGEKGVANVFGGDKSNFQSETVYKIFPLPEGKSLLLVLTNNHLRLTRRLSNGKVDKSYGTDGYSEGIFSYFVPTSGVMLDDGKVVVTGNTDYRASDVFVARFTVNGKLDPSFGSAGVQVIDFGSTNDNALDIAVDSKNRIVVCTSHPGINGFNVYMSLARLTPNGQFDLSFNGTGKVVATLPYYARTIGIQADDKIVAATNINGNIALVRYTSDGQEDLSFGGQGIIFTYIAMNPAILKILPGGNFLLGGGTQNFDPSYTSLITLVKLLADGSPDNSFGDMGIVSTTFDKPLNELTSLLVEPSGKIIAAGYVLADLSNQDQDIAISRYNTNGSPDITFNGTGKKVIKVSDLQDVANAVVVQNGKILLGGYSYVGNGYDLTLVKLNSNGSPDNSFGKNGVLLDFKPAYSSGPVDIQVQSAEKLLVSGSYLRLTGVRAAVEVKNFLARYGQNGLPDNSFGRKGLVDYGVATAFTPVDDKIIISENTNSDFLLRKLKQNGDPDLSFGQGGSVSIDFGGNDYPVTIRQQGRGKFIVGGSGFGNPDGNNILLTRLSNAGVVDPAFGTAGKMMIDVDPGGDDNLHSMIILADGKIIIAGYSYVNGTASVFVMRLTADGNPDPLFGNNGRFIYSQGEFNYVTAMAVQANGAVLLAGATNSFDFTQPQVPWLIRVSTAGVQDNSFGGSGNLAINVTSLQVQQNDKIIVGESQLTNLRQSIRLTRLLNTGFIDNAFGRDGRMTVRVGTGDEGITKLVGNKDQLYVLGGGDGTATPFIVNYRIGNGNTREMIEPESIPAALTLKVVPNPSASSFHLLTEGYSNETNIHLRVTDAVGRLVETKQVVSTNAIHFGENYKPGVYFAELIHANKKELIRLVKL